MRYAHPGSPKVPMPTEPLASTTKRHPADAQSWLSSDTQQVAAGGSARVPASGGSSTTTSASTPNTPEKTMRVPGSASPGGPSAPGGPTGPSDPSHAVRAIATDNISQGYAFVRLRRLESPLHTGSLTPAGSPPPADRLPSRACIIPGEIRIVIQLELDDRKGDVVAPADRALHWREEVDSHCGIEP